MSNKKKAPVAKKETVSDAADPVWQGADTRHHYEVGFKKPPKSTQFRKGQSGNPKGRPKKQKPAPLKFSDAPSDRILEEEIYRLVTLLENGKPVELTALQAIRRSQMASAIKGNRFARKEILEQTEKLEQEKSAEKMARYIFLKECKERGEQMRAEALQKGLPIPELLPHPDDIVLNPVTGEASINGPATKLELQGIQYSVSMRDHLFLRSAHADKIRKRDEKLQEEEKFCGYMVFALFLDTYLPQRFRHDICEVTGMKMKFIGFPRRMRERMLKAEWEELRKTLPPPVHMTPEMQRAIERLSDKLLSNKETNGANNKKSKIKDAA